MLNWTVYGNGYIAEDSVTANASKTIDVRQATYNDIAIRPAVIAIANQKSSKVLTVQFDNDPVLYVPPFTGKTFECSGKNKCVITNPGFNTIPVRVLDKRVDREAIESFLTSPINTNLSTNIILMHLDESILANEGNTECLYEQIGNVVINTSQYKFGGGALSIPDGNSGINIMPSTPYDLSQAFTLDFWIKANGSANDGDVIFTFSDGSSYLKLYYVAAAFTFVLHVNDATIPSSHEQVINADATTFTDWTHIYITREGQFFKCWVGGVDSGALVSVGGAMDYHWPSLYLGISPLAAGFNCYIDEVRFRPGAMWSISPQTPPTTPYS